MLNVFTTYIFHLKYGPYMLLVYLIGVKIIH